MRRAIAAATAILLQVSGLPMGAASGATSPAATPATASAAIRLADSRAASAHVPRGILVYGDSLAVGVQPYATAAFKGAGLPAPTVVGKVGMRASTGIANLRARCSQLPSTVIISLGTNDFWLSSSAAEGWINSMVACAGPNRTIIWVNTYLGTRLAAYAGHRNINRGLLRAAAKHPNVYLIDWASYVASRAVRLHSDGVHPDASGYRKRALLLANAPLIG